MLCVFFFQAEDGIRDVAVTGVQTCALPISDDAVRLAVHHKATAGPRQPHRSEEHTSELQSRLHLVCRLLLEKKTNKQLQHPPHPRAPKTTSTTTRGARE